MIKRFSVGGSAYEYSEKVALSEVANSYVHQLQCDGWEILDIKQFGGILPFDIDKDYVVYEITCSKPDPDIDYNTSKEEKKMEFCEETVSIMMTNFIQKFSKENPLSIEDIDNEINEVKGSISNERIWQKGTNVYDEILMFEQNIADHTEYINRLESLKTKYQDLSKLEKELEEALGENGKIMLEIFADFAKSLNEV